MEVHMSADEILITVLTSDNITEEWWAKADAYDAEVRDAGALIVKTRAITATYAPGTWLRVVVSDERIGDDER